MRRGSEIEKVITLLGLQKVLYHAKFHNPRSSNNRELYIKVNKGDGKLQILQFCCYIPYLK